MELVKRAQELYKFEKDRFAWMGVKDHPLIPLLKLVIRIIRLKQLLHAILTAKSRKQVNTVVERYEEGHEELLPKKEAPQKPEVSKPKKKKEPKSAPEPPIVRDEPIPDYEEPVVKVYKPNYPDLTSTPLYAVQVEVPEDMVEKYINSESSAIVPDIKESFVNRRVPLIDSDDDMLYRIREQQMEMLEQEESLITQKNMPMMRQKVKQSNKEVFQKEQERRYYWRKKRLGHAVEDKIV